MDCSVILDPLRVEYCETSYADPSGRLFKYEGKLLRGVAPEISEHYRNIINHPECDQLFSAGLIETTISHYSSAEYPLILDHRELRPITYVSDWSPAMVHAAAVMVINLSLQLEKLGYELKDANPWNVVFDKTVPKYVDFGSIVPTEGSRWRSLHQFTKSFLRPLLTFSFGQRGLTLKSLLHDRRWGLNRREVLVNLKTRGIRQWIGLEHYYWTAGRKNLRDALVDSKKILEKFKLPTKESVWSSYHSELPDPVDQRTWSNKELAVSRWLDDTHPATIVDVGANQGWFSVLAADKGSDVISMDNDARSIDGLFERAQSEHLNITPVVADLSMPWKAHGRRKEFIALDERIEGALVLCLALIHHLVFKNDVKFPEFFARLRKLTKQWLIVEFIPPDDKYVSQWEPAKKPWYSTDVFLEDMSHHFQLVATEPSTRAPRSLYLAKVRD